MSGPGRPTLYKPEHASRARELCARGATSRCSIPPARAGAKPAIERERPLAEKSKTSGGKGGKGGNLESLGNRPLSDDGAKRRKPGGNWRKPLVPAQGYRME
jgi:hypothetical protein